MAEVERPLVLAIENALQKAFADDGSLLNKYILIAETVGDDGRQCALIASDDLRTWETLGLIEWSRRLIDAHADFIPFDEHGDDDEG